jgi:DNA-binding CsgD family transcriptional regulator
VLRIIILCFLFLNVALQAQELPPVMNYDPSDYGAGNQNWMISKAENGNVYFANSLGLLEFNGARWELYPVPNKTIVRAVKALGDKIFTGAYMEAGYWQKNEFGTLEYHSLLPEFPAAIGDGEQFWRIQHLGQVVVFQSFEGIYLYNLQSEKIATLNTPAGAPISNLFNAGEKIYFIVPGYGLLSIENGIAVVTIPPEILQEREVVYVTGTESALRLITRRGDQFIWDGTVLKEMDFALPKELEGQSIFSALRLDNGSLLLGSVENGIYHVTPNGELVQHFNQENGLQNNTVLSLYLDEEENVWAGLDNGLSILNLNSPFKLYQDHVGKIGTVYTSFQTEDFLYLGTNHGLYYRINGEEEFSLVPGTNGQVWSLQEVDGYIFMGHDNGTYLVDGQSAERISSRLGTWLVQDYKAQDSTYIQGHYNGFSFLKRVQDGFVDLPLVNNFPHSSKFIVSEEDGTIWISNEHKGVSRLKLGPDLRDIKKSKNYSFKEGTGITSSIFKLNGNLFYSDIERIFKYDPEQDKFDPNNALANTFKDVEKISGKMVALEDKVMAFGENAILSADIADLEKNYSLAYIYLPRKHRSIPLGYENITQISDDTFLLGLVDGYLLFDKQFNTSGKDYKLEIDRVTTASLDERAYMLPLQGNKDLEYDRNNLNFYFSIPEYKKYVVPLYSYRLKGLSNRWSEWSTEPVANFENLRYGNYEFEVRAKIRENVTPDVSYSFTVARPWYLSNLAIAGYVVLFLLSLLALHLVYKKEHEKRIRENAKALKMKNLEAEQEIIKLKNEQLEKEMAGKNKELAVSTMSLIKKNEFLTSIKKKLQESESSSEVKTVIRKIDKDINEEDNWKFFKKAFSNADKDFFKKIKSKHPELTSNDLKLCAYLRLNLSSKEIAPLLNISVKSVEIKRYRLRKKMDLPREMNLVEYILSI